MRSRSFWLVRLGGQPDRDDAAHRPHGGHPLMAPLQAERHPHPPGLRRVLQGGGAQERDDVRRAGRVRGGQRVAGGGRDGLDAGPPVRRPQRPRQRHHRGRAGAHHHAPQALHAIRVLRQDLHDVADQGRCPERDPVLPHAEFPALAAAAHLCGVGDLHGARGPVAASRADQRDLPSVRRGGTVPAASIHQQSQSV